MFLRSASEFNVAEIFQSNTIEAPSHAGGTQGALPGISVDDHILGSKSASIVWIEYGDFECPFCGKFHPVTQQMVNEYPDDVQYVYRHFPLSIHRLAQEKAIASECVAELGGEGAFWQYHDVLFDLAGANGTGVALDDLAPLAQQVGVSEAAFNECLTSGRHDAKVNGDAAGGLAAGLASTPSSVVIGPDGSASILEGALSFTQVQAVIDYLLELESVSQ